MSCSPTPRQFDFLRFVRGFQLAKGYSPSFAEVAAGLGLNRRSSAHELLLAMAGRGLARNTPGKPRSIELLVAPEVPRAPDGAPLYFVTIGEPR